MQRESEIFSYVMEVLMLIEQKICKSITLYPTVWKIVFSQLLSWYGLTIKCDLLALRFDPFMFSELHFMYFCYNEWIVLTIFSCAVSIAKANISVLPFHMCVCFLHARSLSHFFSFSVSVHTIYVFCVILIIDGYYSSSFLYYFAENTILWLYAYKVYGNTNNENI